MNSAFRIVNLIEFTDPEFVRVPRVQRICGRLGVSNQLTKMPYAEPISDIPTDQLVREYEAGRRRAANAARLQQPPDDGLDALRGVIWGVTITAIVVAGLIIGWGMCK